MTEATHEDVVGVILAGGLSRRFGGGDKCLRALGGQTLLGRVVERAAPQVGHLIMNASGDAARFTGLGLETVPDIVGGALGPLAGVLTGMAWAKSHVRGAQWVATFASDAPFLPVDLIDRLYQDATTHKADIAMATSNERVHPVFGLWNISLMENLRHALVDEGVRQVRAWASNHKVVKVDFAYERIDPFFNVNCESDLLEAQALLG